MAKPKKEYIYYYYDERNDDFANNGIDGHPTPVDYQYLPKNIFYRIGKPLVYFLFIPLFALAKAIATPMPVKNRKVLRDRKDKKKGYFIYGNHTSWLPDAVTGPLASLPRQTYTICNPDAINIPGIKMLVRLWGALPTPNHPKTSVAFISALEKLVRKGHPVVIYPEAHIWPWYNDIRDFESTSFYFPIKFDVPCYSKTTIYQKKKNGKMKAFCIFDGPFYPNPDLPLAEAKKDLRDRIYNKMKERVNEFGSVLPDNYHYIKVDTPEEMRSEIKEIK